MPWKQVRPMDEKIRFIGDHVTGVFSFAELCDRDEMSRKTVYKWVDRYMEHGVNGLKDRPRTPHRSPHKSTLAIEEAVLEIRCKHPTWVPKKILVMLERQRRPEPLPSPSTLTRMLRRNGCMTRPRPRRRRAHPGKPTTVVSAPNQLWCADFKGQFKTRDGRYCYPLTVTDAWSRYLFTIAGVLSPDLASTKPAFERLFTTYGLPDRIRTENGTPFASTAWGRLSQRSVWWIQLGIVPELIEAGSTNALVARALIEKKGITIITPNVFIARELREYLDTPVVLLGGLYQHQSESLVGKLTKLCIDHLNFHKAFIGVDGFSQSAGFTGKDMMRAEIIAYIAAKSPQVLVVTDSSKFGKTELTTYFGPQDVDYVITDEGIPASDKTFLEAAGVTVLLT